MGIETMVQTGYSIAWRDLMNRQLLALLDLNTWPSNFEQQFIHQL